MSRKSQKIASTLHRLLKLEALKQGKTLEEITDEVIREGLQERGINPDKTMAEHGTTRRNKGGDKAGGNTE
jgi:hypothetical protein